MRVLNFAFGVAIAGVFLTACSRSANPTVSSSVESNMTTPVLTVITQADPETQLMALILSKAASDQGNSVRILLCGSGGDLALRSPPASLRKPLAPKNMSPVDLMSKLIESSVQVDVCAIYLPNRDFGKESLLDSVGVATPMDVAKFYTQNDAKVLSF